MRKLRLGITAMGEHQNTPAWLVYADRVAPVVVILGVAFGAGDIAQGHTARGLYVTAIGVVAFLANRRGKKRRRAGE